MIALICFFPVLVTTVDGLGAVDPDQLKLMRTLDASRWQAFRFAELPAALPAALSGARIALAVGVIGAFIAEVATPTTGAYPGLGRQIMTDINFQTATGLRGDGDPVRLRAGLLPRTGARRAQARTLEHPTTEERPRERPAAPPAQPAPSCPSCACLAAVLALAACGSKQDVALGALGTSASR